MLNGRFGGYGSYITKRSSYNVMAREKERLGHISPNLFFQDIYSHRMNNILSARCSIDFCEAHAIREGLRNLTLRLRHLADTGYLGARAIYTSKGRQNDLLHRDDIHYIYIISDSLVCLGWIRGLFRIRNPRMQGLIDDILHLMHQLEKENPPVQIVTQWSWSC